MLRLTTLESTPCRYQSTYEELKPSNNCMGKAPVVRYQSTYEELKPASNWQLFLMGNRYQSTYEELKRTCNLHSPFA